MISFQDRPTGYKTKVATVLHYLAFSGSLNRFEAERIGDHCLHSTISNLRNDYHLAISGEPEKVPNRLGSLTAVNRYSLDASSREQALKLLALWRVGGAL